MQNSEKNESCEQSMSIEGALTDKCLEIEPIIEKDSQFVEILVESYLKLAFVYV